MLAQTIRTTTRLLAIPQGFTLTIGGELSMDIGRDGSPGAWPIWCYVAGASLAFALLVLIGQAHKENTTAGPPSGRAVLNVVALAVVPACYVVTGLIAVPSAAYFTGGFLAVTLYVCGYAGLALCLTARGRT